MKNQIKIAYMAKEHLQSLTQLEYTCFSSPWSYNSLKSQLLIENSIFLVALESGIVCGYIGMQYTLDEGYITNLAVLPLKRRLGIGKKLLQALAQSAVERNLSFISLEVRISNIPAINLYESQNFCIVGKRRNFYSKPTEDALIMTKFFN